MAEVRELKDQVKKMLEVPVTNPFEKLELVDAIQRLGVAYHFEDEIEAILQQLMHNTLDHHDNDNDPYTVALRFRLLRQQGYNISCGESISNS